MRGRSGPDGRPTRLVHITTVPATLGFFRGQVQFLQGQGYDVHFLSSPGPVLEQLGRELGATTHRVPMAREMRLVRDVRSLLGLCSALRRIRPDVVHSHTPKAALLGTIAARVLRVDAVVVSIFGLRQMTLQGMKRLVLDLTTWLSCRLADRVWCDSFSVRDEVVARRLGAAEKVTVLGHGSVNGIDADREFSPERFGAATRADIRSECGIPADALVLGFVGRVVLDKGISDLAGAWRILRSKYPSLHLLLVGELEAIGEPAVNVAELFGVDDRVHVIGFRPQTAPYFSAMDIFVLPSHREGFGVTTIEAAAMGLPVVSTLIPGCIDSVEDGVTGILVEPHDGAGLAAAIAAYCDDPSLRAQHGLAGRERMMKDFRQEQIWSELDSTYRSLLARSPAHARGGTGGVA